MPSALHRDTLTPIRVCGAYGKKWIVRCCSAAALPITVQRQVQCPKTKRNQTPTFLGGTTGLLWIQALMPEMAGIPHSRRSKLLCVKQGQSPGNLRPRILKSLHACSARWVEGVAHSHMLMP